MSPSNLPPAARRATLALLGFAAAGAALAPGRVLAQGPVPPPAAAALPAGPITLQDAIAIADERGLAARAARDARDAMRARHRAFAARLLPQLSLGGQALDLNRGITPLLLPTGETQLVTQARNQSSLGLTLAQELPWTGGRLSFSSQLARIDNFGNAVTGEPRVWTTTPLLVGFEQDLFRPRTVRWDQRQNSVTSELAERQYHEAREDAATAVASAFFDDFAAQVALENATTNVAVNDTLYTLNQGRYSVGKIGENDLLQSELALLRARASLDAAKLERDRAEAALKRLLQVDSPDTLRIAAPTMLAPFAVDPDVAVTQALANSSVVEQNELDELQARRRANEASLANRLNATFSAVVGFNQSATILGDAYQSPRARQTLALGVSMPLIQWGAGSADAQAAKLDVGRAGANAQARRDRLREDARFAA
ncbi:MAG TPA: TolC family protein, partial [Longimicrobiales bacterium]|nr:TolC family protein [Longimicrobiales bacterium]